VGDLKKRKEAFMTKEKFELTEEFEILIAERLLGEISLEDNQKLEKFFDENPAVKKAFFEKEGVKRLLSNAADNLEKLQLPEGKRNYLLKLAEPKKSGRIILVTYSVAATVFFSFMIGLYFYTNNLFKEKEGVVGSFNHNESAKSADDEGKLSAPAATDETVSKLKEKKESVVVSKPAVSAPTKSKDTLKDLQKDMFEEGEESDAKSAQKIAAVKVNEIVEEKKLLDQEKSIRGEDKSVFKSKIEAASNAPGYGAPSKSGANKEEKEHATEMAKAPEAKSEKADRLANSNSKKKAVMDGHPQPIIVGELEEASERDQSFEYNVEIQFNGQKQSKKIVSTIDLNSELHKEKMNLKHLLELTGKNFNESKKDSAIKASAPSVSVQDVKSNHLKLSEEKVAKQAEKREDLASFPSESDSSQVKEFALVHTCYIAYQSRNNLAKDAKIKLLEEIKKSLIGLSNFKQDEMLKTWLADIEKELK
jgi:hypothetical protein